MENFINIKATVPLAPGVEISIDTNALVSNEPVAACIRRMVFFECRPVDDAGCDWFYDEADDLVFIGGQRDWVASRQRRHVQLLKAADLIDGADYSAQGNGY